VTTMTDKVRVSVPREIGGRGSLVTVGDRVVPQRFGLVVSPEDDSPDLVLGFQVRHGVPQCRSVELRSAEDGREVMASDLRGIRLEDWLEIAVIRNAMVYETRGEGDTALTVIEPIETVEEVRETKATVRAVRREARRKVTDGFLREVAEVYRANVADNPTAAVARWAGRSHRSAGVYVKQAREKGYLGAAVVGKAGEEQS
jgi:hypothetical protein